MKIQSKKGNSRKIAMTWWNNLSAEYKCQICIMSQELLGGLRLWQKLTGREIEMLYNGIDEDFILYQCLDENKNRGTQRSPFGIGS